MTTPAEQVALILADLRDIDETPASVLRRLESLRDELTVQRDDNDEWIRALAVEQWAKDGEIEFDDGAIVSGCEDGAYVQAWVWVDFPGTDDDDDDDIDQLYDALEAHGFIGPKKADG